MKGRNKLILCPAEMMEVVTVGINHRLLKIENKKITNITENKTGDHSGFEITIEETKGEAK